MCVWPAWRLGSLDPGGCWNLLLLLLLPLLECRLDHHSRFDHIRHPKLIHAIRSGASPAAYSNM
jgi:hypothetical protein